MLGTERNGSLLGVYLAGLASALAAYTAWLIDQGNAVDDPARLYGGYIKSLEGLQAIYQSLETSDKSKARAVSYRLIRAHAYTLTIYAAA